MTSKLVKIFKNLLLQNQSSDDLETWYTCSTWSPPSLYKWWPFSWHGQLWKCWNIWFHGKFRRFWLKMGLDSFQMIFWRFVSTRGHSHSFTFDPGLSNFEDSKHLIQSHWASCNQSSYRVTKGGGNKILFKPSMSHDRYAYILKNLFKESSPEPIDRLPWNLVFLGLREQTCSNGSGAMTNMNPCPYIVQTYKKSSSLKPMEQCLETWYVAFGVFKISSTKIVQIMTLGWHWSFYGKVKNGNASSLAACAFWFGNAVEFDGFKYKGSRSISDFAQRSLEKIVHFDLEMQSTLVALNTRERSRSISDLAQRSLEKIVSFLWETNRLLTFLFKLANNQDRHKFSDGFEMWLYWRFRLGVTCSGVLR